MAEDKKTVDSQQTDGDGDKANVVTKDDFEKFKAEMLKSLEDEKKMSSGKDKKITELQGELKQFQQKTLSQEQLVELQRKELEEQKAEFEKQQVLAKMENERERRENLINKVVRRYVDKWPGLSKYSNRIQGNTEEEIEIDIKQFVKDYLTDQNRRDNASKVTGRPQSGNGKQLDITMDEIDDMTPAAQRQLGATASKEQILNILQQAQERK